MLEQIDLTKEMGKEEYKEKMEILEGTLSRLQRECRDLGIPVMILLKGSEQPEKECRSIN